MRRLILMCVFLMAIAIGLERLYAYQHGGFCLKKILSSLEGEKAEKIPVEIDALLQQSFCFLGSGGTCFAFLGQDGKTVLKLFKHHHFSSKKQQLHKRQSFLFKSCQLAEEELKQETGLLYLCLQKNPNIRHIVTLIDRWGFAHRLPLAQTEFALQKRAVPLFCHLQKLLCNGRLQECKTAIDALLAQIASRTGKSIADRDPHLCINFGYCEEYVIEFDIGSFFQGSAPTPFTLARELFFCTRELQKWLEKENPELLHYVYDQIIKTAA